MTSIVTGVYKFKSYSNKIIFLSSIFLIKGLNSDNKKRLIITGTPKFIPILLRLRTLYFRDVKNMWGVQQDLEHPENNPLKPRIMNKINNIYLK